MTVFRRMKAQSSLEKIIKMACYQMTFPPRAGNLIKSLCLCLITVLACCGVALAGVDEDIQENDSLLADISMRIAAEESREPLGVFELVPDIIILQERGSVFIKDPGSEPVEEAETPPLPLDIDKEIEESSGSHASLPRETNISKLGSYSTNHVIPARTSIPLPGLIMVHDPDREEKLLFGVFSLTIRW